MPVPVPSPAHGRATCKRRHDHGWMGKPWGRGSFAEFSLSAGIEARHRDLGKSKCALQRSKCLSREAQTHPDPTHPHTQTHTLAHPHGHTHAISVHESTKTMCFAAKAVETSKWMLATSASAAQLCQSAKPLHVLTHTHTHARTTSCDSTASCTQF